MLARLGVPFTVQTSDVDEAQGPGESAEALVRRLAMEKARAVAAHRPGCAVLGADTVVVLNEAVLGKPDSADEAAAMLRALRGRDHRVLSAVYACRPASGLAAGALNETRVAMRSYSDAEIADYVASGDPMDKAGAYAIQSAAFRPVARLAGCYAGVMGFPLAEVMGVLRAVGIHLPADVVAACEPSSGRCCQRAP